MLSSTAPEGFSSSSPASTGEGSPELSVGLRNDAASGIQPHTSLACHMLGGGSRAHFYSLIKM